MSVGLVIDPDASFGLTERKLRRLASADIHDLMDTIGAEVESQTKRRIEGEKRSAGGEGWPAWSPRYAKTRHSGHSLLMNEGHLDDSIQYLVSGREVEIGSNLVYARNHQVGSTVPQREYLGLSDDNRRDIEDLVSDFLEDLLR